MAHTDRNRRRLSRKTYSSWTVPSYSHFTDNNTFASLTSPQKSAVLFSQETDVTAIQTQEGGSNPNPLVALYKEMATCSKNSDQGVTYTTAHANGWIMLDGSSLEVDQNDSINYLFDPAASGLRNPATTGSLPQHIYATLTDGNHSHYNAVFFDNCMPDYRGLYSGTTFRGASYPTVVSYATPMVTLCAGTCAYLQQKGYYCIGNSRALVKGSYAGDGTFVADDNKPTNTYTWWNLLVYPSNNTLGPGGTAWRPGQPIFDALMIENWIVTAQGDGTGHTHIRRTGNANSYDFWTEWIAAQTTCQAKIIIDESGNRRPVAYHGHAYLGTTPSTDATDLARGLYGYASFLLQWDASFGNSVCVIEPQAGNSYLSGFGTTKDLAYPKVGTFSSALEVSTTNSNTLSPGSTIWRRDFLDLSGGSHIVLVNPTYSDVTFTGGDYTGALANGTAVIT